MDSPTLILITRPRMESVSLHKTLQKKGYKSLQFPLIRIVPLQQNRRKLHLPSQIQGWLFSSANGVLQCLRAFNYEPLFESIWRHQPALAIGKITAQTLSQKGFSNVQIAETTNSTGLYELALAMFSPERGTILHPGGKILYCNITDKLCHEGFDARKLTLYESIAAREIAPHIAESFRNGIITHVTLFSTRTAEIFVELMKNAQLDAALSTCTCLCLSDAISKIVQPLHWREIKIATEPTTEKLIELLPKLPH